MRTLITLPMILGSLFALGSAACMTDDDKGEEEDVPLDGKLDGFANPTDHGALTFGTPADSELTAAAGFHTWTFTLSGDASLDIKTTHPGPGPKLDTVLYLYKQKADGNWGSYISRNDDFDSTKLSRIRKSLGAGTYRVLVKGYNSHTRGKFSVTAGCDGDGCTQRPVGCLFGDTFNDVTGDGAIRRTYNRRLTAANIGELSDVQKQQIILALHESVHDDVTTIEQAFEAADQGEINLIGIWDDLGARDYDAVEYGAGDNSYGAIFDGDTTVRATSIHDGDFYNCVAVSQVCSFGPTFGELDDNTRFTHVSETKILRASDVSGVAAQQALIAIQVAYEEATDLANGLELVDDNEVWVTRYKDTATGKVYDAYSEGAGDNTFGMIFEKGSLERAAKINDSDIYSCAVFDE